MSAQSSSKPQNTSSSTTFSVTDEGLFPRRPSYFSMILPHCEPGLKLAGAAAVFAWAVRDYVASEEANRIAALANQLALVSVCISNTGTAVTPETCTAYLSAFNGHFSKITEAVAAQEGLSIPFVLADEKLPKALLGIFAEMAIVLIAVLLAYVGARVCLDRYNERKVVREGARLRGI